ncbi:phage holin family protein [Cryptosporangium sp. NPDC051539]|uniref:phage holin family protein n=1 Tax=Cryptosporangium sp. NPDC051539 TaxID=3363962 RepID=UPI0037A7030A
MGTQTEVAPAPSPGRPDPANASTAELVTRLSDQVTTLVRDELRLAQLELTQKGKKAGIGAGMFGGAGVVALYGVGALVTAAIAGLAVVLPVWASALIIAVVLFAVAGVLALTGKKEFQQATPPVPSEAVDGVKKDIDTVKERAHR